MAHKMPQFDFNKLMRNIRPEKWERPIPPLSSEAVGTVAAAGHASVRESDPYSFAVAHRRLAWMFRLSVGMNITLAAGVVFLASAVSALSPLKTTEIALVKTDPATDLTYRIEPVSPTMDGFDLLMQHKARSVVRLMWPVDPSLEERWTEGARLFDKSYYKSFKAKVEPLVKALNENAMFRAVQVETSSTIGQPQRINGEDQYLYSVDFVQVDSKDGQVTKETPARAFLTLVLRPREVPERDIYENPLGVRVLNFSVQSRPAAVKTDPAIKTDSGKTP